MTAHPEDRGLGAVARVRGVREQDSRIGLQQAVGRLRTLEEQATTVRAGLEAARFPGGTGGQFLAHRNALRAQGELLLEVEGAAAVARTVELSARERWQGDRSRVRAVATLLERRAAARRSEADRAEARELDDIAARLWLRGRTPTSTRNTKNEVHS